MSNSFPFSLLEGRPHRERLVAALQAGGCLRSDTLTHAFLHVPREAFVVAFYQRQAEPGMIWAMRRATQVEPEQWLQQVYQDEPLVTKLDERNWPISSSSAPSVMARMLEVLDIQPGNRVLEIGTGSVRRIGGR